MTPWTCLQTFSYILLQTTTILRQRVARRYGSVVCPTVIHVWVDIDTYPNFRSFLVEEVLDYHADRPVHSRPASCLLREWVQRLWCSHPSNAFVFPAYSYFSNTYWPELPSLGNCNGTESAAVFGCALLSSYLLLFIKFYIDTYKKPARGKKPITNGYANGNGLVQFDVDSDSRLTTFVERRFKKDWWFSLRKSPHVWAYRSLAGIFFFFIVYLIYTTIVGWTMDIH